MNKQRLMELAGITLKSSQLNDSKIDQLIRQVADRLIEISKKDIKTDKNNGNEALKKKAISYCNEFYTQLSEQVEEQLTED